MQRELLSDRRSRAAWWIWSSTFALTVVLIVVFVFLRAPSSNSLTSLNLDELTSVSELAVSVSLEPNEIFQVAMKKWSSLPPMDFPSGSVEEACDFNDFPPYHLSTFESGWDLRTPLTSDECWSAMETHINTINPFLLDVDTERRRPFQFVVMEEPLTFERVFADPTGDFIRVKDALSRPECLLTGDETKWELKDSCHAEAFLNYALINRNCLGSEWERAYTFFFPNIKNLTPEQDRLMWKQDLEDVWVEMKCEKLHQTLEFSPERQPELHKLVMSFQSPTARMKKYAEALLIELSARLGDDAAGLTLAQFPEMFIPRGEKEEGAKFGRFAELLTSTTWKQLALKQAPNTDHFFQIFHMLATAESREVDTLKEIRFDYGQLVQHMCIPPSLEFLADVREDGTIVHFNDPELLLELEPEALREMKLEPEDVENFFEPKSCQEIVHEIRQQRGIKSPTVLAVIDKFEKAALEIGVYE